jgi:hypothetical protein
VNLMLVLARAAAEPSAEAVAGTVVNGRAAVSVVPGQAMRVRVLLLLLAAAACGPADRAPAQPEADAGTDVGAAVDSALGAVLRRAEALADSIDRLFRPVPLLPPAQEAVLRQYGTVPQMARARSLGVKPRDSAHVAALLADGTLVALEDSTPVWVLRDLDYSAPYVTPDTRRLLQRVGERFQARLREMGLPDYRLEVSSVLRTPADQAALRRVNPNAAAGESSHEYGTTLDVLYASYAAPADHGVAYDTAGVAWLEPHLDRIVAALLESVAARNSREMQAILGGVLTELQRAGDVMVTLERQQPVYHFTLARPQAEGGR